MFYCCYIINYNFARGIVIKYEKRSFCSCELESIVQQVEWVTLLFFGSMFITMECLARLGLIDWIGKQTEYLILLADEQMRLTLAIVIILWVCDLDSCAVCSINLHFNKVNVMILLLLFLVFCVEFVRRGFYTSHSNDG